MIDLSNNNGGHVDFERLFRAGQRRVYLKATEGMHFTDLTYELRLRDALRAGFKVGAYHFAHPRNDPVAEAVRFHAVVGNLHHRRHLRPALDFEYGTPSATWANRFLNKATQLFGVRPVIYSYGDFLHRAGFRLQPAALWLASYGKDDGREHPFSVPWPFTRVAAHQYASRARVPGIQGDVDISRVFIPKAIDVPALSVRRVAANHRNGGSS